MFSQIERWFAFDGSDSTDLSALGIVAAYTSWAASLCRGSATEIAIQWSLSYADLGLTDLNCVDAWGQSKQSQGTQV